MRRRPLVIAGAVSLLILAANATFPVPAISDPAGALLPAGLTLSFPTLNLVLAPLFDLWDGVTLLAMSRLHAFLVLAVGLIAAWSLLAARGPTGVRWLGATLRLVGGTLGLGLFILGGIRWRRPMAHLAGVPADLVVVDLHSHTNESHDAKSLLQRDFDLETSRAWHRRGGFDAFFVTDHNLLNHAVLPYGDRGTPVACPGEELSLWGAHIVLLGNRDSVPRAAYADSEAGIERLFQQSESLWHAVTLASIPEYDEHHFADLPAWIAAGVDGFEISNAAPKANEQSHGDRDSVIHLARANGKWLAGVTDQHGMGGTVQAWTLIARTDPTAAIPGAAGLCGEILARLTHDGATATRIIERHHLRADARWPYWATIVAVPWEAWRSAGVGQLVSWLAWTWGIALLAALHRRPEPR